ncbi:MAG: hypothetical protein Q8M94_17945 [Ignavibacteria bacterium]|nr:hypothetical protein [Ignavibacteria bacterium]
MENKTLASQLKEIKLTDNKKMDSLSKAISVESRKDAFELIKILHSGKEEESKKASMVLMSIGDLAITPMLESIDTKDPDNYAWEMDIILSLYLGNRNKISILLNSMFLDKRQLKGPELLGVVEEKPVPRRVCDEAYLMFRRLTAFKEDEEEIMMNERMFLDMTDDQRDKEIERLKSSKEWISLLEHLSDEGEF